MFSHAVFQTSEICRSYGIRYAVFSPGSRNAPLIISFARNNGIKKWIIPDERSAGFIALGMAQKSRKPVVLCCTSGTALLHYGPAVAEAYYREIPLLILSADRPPELIDQRDGQTIRQFGSLKNHVKASCRLPVIENKADKVEYRRRLAKALNRLYQLPAGPVHINVPFKEPLYPCRGQTFSFEKTVPVKPGHHVQSHHTPSDPKFFDGKKVLILVGQHPKDDKLNARLRAMAQQIPVIQSPLNNLNVNGIRHIDLFPDNRVQLKPDVLITSGLAVLSKKLKRFLRTHKPDTHFHFDPANVPVDTFSTRPEIFTCPLERFLENDPLKTADHSYSEQWRSLSKRAAKAMDLFSYPGQLTETQAFREILRQLPGGCELHLGNSMPVRFADIFGVPDTIETWGNRGASGIDGCVSSAVGHALVSNKCNVLLTGDVTFLYDRNAFFHKYMPANLRIIVSNNEGGGIFRLIDGPSRLPELEDYFETRHNFTCEYICMEHMIEYRTARSMNELERSLKGFFKKSGQPKLLEVFTDPVANEEIFKKFIKYVNRQLHD